MKNNEMEPNVERDALFCRFLELNPLFRFILKQMKHDICIRQSSSDNNKSKNRIFSNLTTSVAQWAKVDEACSDELEILVLPRKIKCILYIVIKILIRFGNGQVRSPLDMARYRTTSRETVNKDIIKLNHGANQNRKLS